MSIDEAIEKESKIAKENQKIVDTQIVFDNVSISELYCDDTEVIEEHLSNYKKCAEYHEQIAEWLEELKELRSMVKCNAFTDGYNKGIDDFLEIADKMEREDVLYYAALDEAAEQLKESEKHGY